MLLIAKTIAAPLLIWMLTVIGRRFGPGVSGLLMGIPLITGPVSFFSAVEQGSDFAAKAAVANLVGQVSTCLFCFAFAKASPGWNSGLSAVAGVGAFLTATVFWDRFEWELWPASILLLATIAALPFFMPDHPHINKPVAVPRWDLPLRMAISAAFVLVMTQAAGMIGPQMSGLIAPFPTFVLILAVFTHREAGGEAAANLARGVVLGSLSFAAFFLCVVLGLQSLGLWIYPVAALASVGVSAILYTRRRSGPAQN